MKCQGWETEIIITKLPLEMFMNCIGIDVSAKELTVVVSVNGKMRKAKTLKNAPSGFKALAQIASKLKGNVKVCLEATGIYHFDLAISLSQEKGISLMVINPKVASNFAKVMMARSKTDGMDAEILAIYAERMPFEEWQRPAEEVLALRAYARRIAALNKLKTQTKNQLHALISTAETPSLVINQVKELIQVLEKQIEDQRNTAIELIKQHAELLNAFVLITGIKGIAKSSAVQILAELMILPSDMNAKQWVAHAGLDPRAFQSGASVDKKTRISKAGNKYIRQALYMPALVAIRYEPHIKGFYDHMINDNGLSKMQALCAVMRKLLHAIHGMLKTNKNFEGQRFYQFATEVTQS